MYQRLSQMTDCNSFVKPGSFKYLSQLLFFFIYGFFYVFSYPPYSRILLALRVSPSVSFDSLNSSISISHHHLLQLLLFHLILPILRFFAMVFALVLVNAFLLIFLSEGFALFSFSSVQQETGCHRARKRQKIKFEINSCR